MSRQPIFYFGLKFWTYDGEPFQVCITRNSVDDTTPWTADITYFGEVYETYELTHESFRRFKCLDAYKASTELVLEVFKDVFWQENKEALEFMDYNSMLLKSIHQTICSFLGLT